MGSWQVLCGVKCRVDAYFTLKMSMDLYRDGRGENRRGGEEAKTEQPRAPLPTSTTPQAMQRTDATGWNGTKDIEGKEAGTSGDSKGDSVSKTKLRQEKEKEKEFRMPETAAPRECGSAACSKCGGLCCGIWLRGGHCPTGRHLHGTLAPVWSSMAGPGDEKWPEGKGS